MSLKIETTEYRSIVLKEYEYGFFQIGTEIEFHTLKNDI